MEHSERDTTLTGRRYPVAGVRRSYRKGFLSGFRYAGDGLRYAFLSQPNFRFHLAMTVAVVLLGAWLNLSVETWALLAMTVGGVLVTEMLNTAAEALVDLVSPEYHPLAKQIKDLMAGAVLVAALVSVTVGLLVLGPPLWRLVFP